MIGILLNDASYEQDIRELLMAFYPGEGFAHERTGGVDFYVEGTYEPESGTFSLDILENEEKKAGASDRSAGRCLPGHFLFLLPLSLISRPSLIP